MQIVLNLVFTKVLTSEVVPSRWGDEHLFIR